MKEISNSKERLIVLFSILFMLIISYIGLVIYNNRSLKEYNDKLLPSTYIDEFDMSYYTYDNAIEKINYVNDYVLNKKIKVNINSKEYEYSLNDLGFSINTGATIDSIKKSQKKYNFSTKLMMINGTRKDKYSFIYNIDDNKLRETLKSLKGQVDYGAVNAYFDTSEGVKYLDGTNGFALNIDNSINNIHDALSSGINKKTNISLSGDVIKASSNESYKSIDTKTSSFSTVFMPYTWARNINLNLALSLING